MRNILQGARYQTNYKNKATESSNKFPNKNWGAVIKFVRKMEKFV